MMQRDHHQPAPAERRAPQLQLKQLYPLISTLLISIFLLSACDSILGRQNQAADAQVTLPAYEASHDQAPAAPVQDESAQEGETNTAASQNEVAPPVDAQTADTQNTETTTANSTNGASAQPSIAVRGDYNGEVVANDTVAVVAEVNGMAQAVTVDVGDAVAQGQVLVRIDTTMLEAQRAQALAGLEAAQAQLEQMLRAPDADDIAAAEAAINAASAAYAEVTKGASAEDLRIMESQLQQAEAAVRQARAAYNDVRWNPKIAMLPQSLALQSATLQLEAVQAQYDKVIKGATNDLIAGAYAQLVQARSQLARLQEGASAEQIRAMQAQVSQAEVGLYMAQLQLDKAAIKAPMDGIVIQRNVSSGGMVAPGAPLFVLRSPDVKIVIPVEELRLPTIAIGQPALVRANAYPDRVFQGEISKIAPQLDPQTRTIQVTIQPTEPADVLLPGMFAAVDLLEE
ncbi:MAG: efflux RND transporter periplasmic adaptor subunit [Caldilineaceae bacterium]